MSAVYVLGNGRQGDGRVHMEPVAGHGITLCGAAIPEPVVRYTGPPAEWPVCAQCQAVARWGPWGRAPYAPP